MKNKAKITLSLVIATAILTMNTGSLLKCTSLTMQDDCCHITKTVKPCCAKNMKITLKERLSGHCGCIVDEKEAAGDMYFDIKNSQQAGSNRNIAYIDCPASMASFPGTFKYNAGYSPPHPNMSDTYLNILSLRI